ncbi:MAG: hypothetical protein LC713_03010, partial [Actinobacteria bacterium]|nr:hypothetical protein [Actinomycetota bacterium]
RDDLPRVNEQGDPTGSLEECLEGPEGCRGPVEWRWPGYGDRCWPRCQHHGDERVKREDEAIDRYGNPDSPCAPPGFDPDDAGESWSGDQWFDDD